jgi:hypothetical protein
LLIATSAASGQAKAESAVATKCGPAQILATLSGHKTCIGLGQACKKARDAVYHRYGFHCVVGRLARHHPGLRVEHGIGVRTVNGDGEFFDRATGEKFIPRGTTYLVRGPQSIYGSDHIYTSTFIVGRYDEIAAEAALESMHNDGYNVVRVFLDLNCFRGCLGDPSTPGDHLSVAYVTNVVDFLWRAKNNGLRVLLIADETPNTTPYRAAVDHEAASFRDQNAWVLPDGAVRGFGGFWQALITMLVRQGAPLDSIWAYSLSSETFFASNSLPLSQTSGVVTTANGHVYDMAVPLDRQRMMDDGLVYWIDQVREAIRAVDPTALVTLGFFWPQGPNPVRAGDPRLIRTEPAVERSHADFVDLHAYPGIELNLPQYVQNFELPLHTAKPIVMGEFGAFQFSYPTVTQAADALRAWQIESCRYGFDGWLLWTWDTQQGGEGEPPMWNARSEGGVIDQALAPRLRPDPCA